MKSASYFCIVLFIVFCLYATPSSAATIAHWDFEDGTDGALLSSLPNGDSVDIENGYVMYGYGPSFSSEKPISNGLSAYCDGGDLPGRCTVILFR